VRSITSAYGPRQTHASLSAATTRERGDYSPVSSSSSSFSEASTLSFAAFEDEDPLLEDSFRRDRDEELILLDEEGVLLLLLPLAGLLPLAFLPTTFFSLRGDHVSSEDEEVLTDDKEESCSSFRFSASAGDLLLLLAACAGLAGFLNGLLEAEELESGDGFKQVRSPLEICTYRKKPSVLYTVRYLTHTPSRFRDNLGSDRARNGGQSSGATESFFVRPRLKGSPFSRSSHSRALSR